MKLLLLFLVLVSISSGLPEDSARSYLKAYYKHLKLEKLENFLTSDYKLTISSNGTVFDRDQVLKNPKILDIHPLRKYLTNWDEFLDSTISRHFIDGLEVRFYKNNTLIFISVGTKCDGTVMEGGFEVYEETDLS
ncbi:unnamed protein product [Caenorhabditis angaria]|uniref:DUF38 domain-containing protein n=1 Tax=Caenorhabditis angaria TaxID=860376 RepID=A0A9P1IE33_9PELO|nr:unnamed protein product [Caenorhabditis angaria]